MPALTGSAGSPFIVGVARSGTTLLRLMLDAHPQVAIPAETHFIPAVLAPRATGRPPDREEFLHRVTSFFTWPDFGIARESLAEGLAAVVDFTPAEGIRTFFRICAARQGKALWGDKTPPYVEHIAVISQALPEARFIHLIRDGRAVAASRRHLSFGPGADIRAQALDWGRKIREARRQAADYPHYLEVRYEDLVLRPEAVLHRVCEHLGLAYAPSMLEYHRTARQRLAEFQDWSQAPGGGSLSGDYRRAIQERTSLPPDRERIDHWRNVLQPDEIRVFEEAEGGLLAEIGYEAANG